MEGAPNVITYIDDVLIHSPTAEEHVKNVREALSRLRRHNLKINLGKCVIGAKEVQYLGHTLTGEGVKPGHDKAAAVKNAHPPRNVKQVRSFTGLCNYFRSYVKDFSKIAAPLFNLTRDDSDWEGGPLPTDARRAFETLKTAISTEPILSYPTRDGKYHLFTDAAVGDKNNAGGLGAVLMQEKEDGDKAVISYASRRIHKNEMGYPPFLLEMQAAVYGMETFEHYLRGRRFCLHTDHKPLCKLETKHNQTLNRLQMKMLTMFPEIRYIPGEKNTIADFLSRYDGMGVAAVDTSPSRLKDMQDQDNRIANFKKLVADKAQGRDGELVRVEGATKRMMLRKDILIIEIPIRKGFVTKDRLRVVIPEAMTEEIIQEAHDSKLAGHGGIFKTAERIRERFWWPKMDKQIGEHIQRCEPCQATSDRGAQKINKLQPLPIPEGPNMRVHVDLFGPLKDPEGAKKHILVMTDAFTKLVSLKTVNSKEADVVAKAILDGWIYTYGVPKVILSDGGLEFCNELQKALFEALQIEIDRVQGKELGRRPLGGGWTGPGATEAWTRDSPPRFRGPGPVGAVRHSGRAAGRAGTKPRSHRRSHFQ